MTNRVVQGALPGGGYGLLVSRPGFNVLGGLSGKQTAFDSRWPNTLKMVTQGVAVIPTSGDLTVNYGVTVSNPFVAVVMRHRANGQWKHASAIYDAESYEEAANSTSSIQSALNADSDPYYVTVFTNRIVLTDVIRYDRVSYLVAER